MEALDNIPGGAHLHELTQNEFESNLNQLADVFGRLEDVEERDLALKLGMAHPVWQVRSHVLNAAAQWTPMPKAEEVILNATHDSVDVVAFQAIRLCGELKLQEAISHLVRISGWPSDFTKPGYLRKPVGIGAALTKRALLNIFGSEDYEELTRLEEKFLASYRALSGLSQREPSKEGMILIPEGPCVIGMTVRSDFQFEFNDYVYLEPHQVDVPAFLIDAKPVTNQEYRVFARDIEVTGHMTCHPDEPPNKDHWPSHLFDSRFGQDDMPVTGIDWYDAYAYAEWCGKALPTEIQWEKAARGTDGCEYPWGNEWKPELANHFETVFGSEVGPLSEWEEVLRKVSDKFPLNPLWPVGSRPDANSPYGISDMAGNVWEWTRTNFATREPMDPFFKGRELLDFTNRPAAFPVIRGGCWTSLPEMLRCCYRGKDLLTDRHFEIGFRCVLEL